MKRTIHIDEDTHGKFKKKIAKDGIKMTNAATQAIRDYINKAKEEEKK